MPGQSPCRKILTSNKSYGHLLYDFLLRFGNLDATMHVLEIGGGYGFLMKDLLQKMPFLNVTMIDISPHLMQMQRELLKGHDVAYIREDFLDTNISRLSNIDLAIMNENIGDFPTLLDVRPETVRPFSGAPDDDGTIYETSRLISYYDLDIPSEAAFHFNLGAAMAIEKLCCANVKCIFVSEHSCEASVPAVSQPYVKLSSAGVPERIPLKGHDEYTIQFSYLEKIAAAHHYDIKRGPIADYITIEMSARLRCLLTAPAPRTDEDEILRHFVEDIYKYEYLLLTKQKNAAQYEAVYETCPPPTITVEL
ncbi:MAG: class I SAM-dependent methyltransferase [Syntrophales bacterium]|nr:class I SAM-dependent methyltransferase [Syntrophales bacterium]